jgi:hypothetical protein
VQTGGPATVGKTTFGDRFRDHRVCDGYIPKPAAVWVSITNLEPGGMNFEPDGIVGLLRRS